jgi:predicted small lipoprotein YifL
VILRSLAAFAVLLSLTACGPQSPPAAGPEAAASATAPAAPAITPTPTAPISSPPPLDNPLTLGSQQAKDEMYCAGLLEAAFPVDEAQVPVVMAQIFRAQEQAMSLRLDGTGKLIDEGVAVPAQTGAVAGAWADKAADDFEKHRPRITVARCQERGRLSVCKSAGQSPCP